MTAGNAQARARSRGIENKSDYVRDTTWREDANQSYTGNGPHALA